MKKDKRETRKVLWGQNSTELFRAQDLDAEAERLEGLLTVTKEQAAACRVRAAEFAKAAKELGELDGEGK